MTGLAGAPLGQAEFAALMAPLGPWGAARHVAVAVSGGADSLCLAWLAAGWGRPLALIVDHGLREESGTEAGEAAGRLAGIGVAARIVRLHGLGQGPGLAARARAARYRALSQAAAAEGLCDLLVGHHAGDQAETVLIRREAQSGRAGLAGMAPVSETEAVRLVRPLLGIARARRAPRGGPAGLAGAADPSTATPRPARRRGRARLADAMQGCLLMRGVLEAACEDAAWRCGEEAAAARLLAERASVFPEGHALLSPGPVTPAALAALIRTVGGSPYPARGAALARLAGGVPAGTLGGVRFQPAGRLGAPGRPSVLVVREVAAMQRPVAARHGALWDRRFLLGVEGDLPHDAELGALGGDAAGVRRLSALPAAVLRTLPALRAQGGLAVPHLGYFRGWTNRRVRLTLQPSLPLAGRHFGVGDAQRAPNPHVL